MPLHPEARKKVMNHLLRGDALGAHSTYWLALHNTTLSTATLPSTATEVTTVGTGYARMPLTSGMFTSATTSLSTCWLTTRVQFPDPLVNWTTARGFSIHDSSVRSSGGAGSTCWFFGDVNTPVVVSAGNPVAISSGSSTNGLQIGLA